MQSETMTALGYYANATSYILNSTDLNEHYFLLLQETLSPLRFYLACRVCNKLLIEPMTPDHTACQHTVCAACIGGKMRLRPACGWCQGYENFKPNSTLAHLVKCYSKLCHYVYNSLHYKQQLEFVKDDHRVEMQGYKDKVASFIKEGCDYIIAKDVITSSHASSAAVQSTISITADPALTPTTPTMAVDKEVVSPTESEGHVDTSPARDKKKLRKRLGSTQSDTKLHVKSPAPMQVIRSVSTDQTVTAQANSDQQNQLDVSLIKKARTSSKLEKKGCGCGTAATAPGKLTCYGQRCPCYSNHNPCLDCRCKGCRNPNKYVKIENASEDTDNEINVD